MVIGSILHTGYLNMATKITSNWRKIISFWRYLKGFEYVEYIFLRLICLLKYKFVKCWCAFVHDCQSYNLYIFGCLGNNIVNWKVRALYFQLTFEMKACVDLRSILRNLII